MNVEINLVSEVNIEATVNFLWRREQRQRARRLKHWKQACTDADKILQRLIETYTFTTFSSMGLANVS